MGTSIIPGTVVDRKQGYRRQPAYIFHEKRYDVYGGDGHYRYSENRHYGSTYHESVPTTYATIELPSSKTITFDLGGTTIFRGDPVHVIEHRVLGRRVHDLYEDKYGIMSVWGDDPFRYDINRNWAIAFAAVVGLICYYLDIEIWHAIGYGCYSGIGFFVLLHAIRACGSRTLGFLRWKTRRELRRRAKKQN
jgi:hypothetical protein